MRVLTAIICTMAIVGLYGCGGSSYLSESPSMEDFLESTVVRIHATGWDDAVTSAGASKGYFVSGTFTGDGTVTGSDLTDTIVTDCKFDNLEMREVVPGNGLAAISLAPDLASCVDKRNCCVYTKDADYVDACVLNVQCVVDPALADLGNTYLRFEFMMRQDMTTNMPNDTGLIATAIEETTAAVSDIMDLTSTTLTKTGCDSTSGNSEFDVEDSVNPWFSFCVAPNCNERFTSDTFMNVDYIGDVAVVGPDTSSSCTLYYDGMFGAVSLVPVASNIDVEETVELRGNTMICNDRDYYNCDGTGLYVFP